MYNQWFGVELIGERSIVHSVNRWLESLRVSIEKVFNVEKDISVDSLLNKVLQSEKEDNILLAKWLKTTGLQILRYNLSVKLLNNIDIIAIFDYRKYILDEEIEFGDLDGLKAMIVNDIVDLKEVVRVNSC